MRLRVSDLWPGAKVFTPSRHLVSTFRFSLVRAGFESAGCVRQVFQWQLSRNAPLSFSTSHLCESASAKRHTVSILEATPNRQCLSGSRAPLFHQASYARAYLRGACSGPPGQATATQPSIREI